MTNGSTHETRCPARRSIAEHETHPMSFRQNEDLNRSHKMHLMYEDLARAHIDARLADARERRVGAQLARSRRLARQAKRVNEQVRLVLARSV